MDRTSACGAGDPGSNPGESTINLLTYLDSFPAYFCFKKIMLNIIDLNNPIHPGGPSK